jgi:tetraprenyl-beta-curcumene synthase
MFRFWLQVAPRTWIQLRAWKAAAAAIPEPAVRALALETLRTERLSAFGAALVATTAPGPTNYVLVQLLVALQVAWDYIDTLAEQPAADVVANGAQLHRALLDAISRAPARNDYFDLAPQHDDHGYLAALVASCRDAYAKLPAAGAVRAVALNELKRAEIQYVNHAPAKERIVLLQRWASAHRDDRDDAGWIELAAAASSSLGVLALLATAADRNAGAARIEQVRSAYCPWIDALTALLDSLVDRSEDTAGGLMNWIAHYPSDAVATARLEVVARRAVAGARALPHGERHLVIVAGMVAMHLSHASARAPQTQVIAHALLRATDAAAVRPLLAMLRRWRQIDAARERRRAGKTALGARHDEERLTRPPAAGYSVLSPRRARRDRRRPYRRCRSSRPGSSRGTAGGSPRRSRRGGPGPRRRSPS